VKVKNETSANNTLPSFRLLRTSCGRQTASVPSISPPTPSSPLPSFPRTFTPFLHFLIFRPINSLSQAYRREYTDLGTSGQLFVARTRAWERSRCLEATVRPPSSSSLPSTLHFLPLSLLLFHCRRSPLPRDPAGEARNLSLQCFWQLGGFNFDI
jgi:hypothetical protein